MLAGIGSTYAKVEMQFAFNQELFYDHLRLFFTMKKRSRK